jgi:hypothetical protein
MLWNGNHDHGSVCHYGCEFICQPKWLSFAVDKVRTPQDLGVAIDHSRYNVHSDLDCVGSITAIPCTRYVPFLLCHERFNEASLPVCMLCIECIICIYICMHVYVSACIEICLGHN